MSAAILLRQRDSAFILTDAAGYYGSGEVAQFADKCRPLPELHCAFTTFGPLMWREIIATGIRQRGFASFDSMKAGIAPLMRELFDFCRDDVTISTEPGENGTEASFIGWSTERQMPDAFVVRMYDVEATKIRFGMDDVPPPFVIDDVYLMHSPCPTQEQLDDARLPFSLKEISLSGLERLNPEVDLLHLMEIQRRTVRGGNHTVGGYAYLTRVDRFGITQRRIHEWPEDKIGELIKPPPIDWVKWRAERDPAHLSAQIIQMQSPPVNRHERRKLKAGARR